jgi:hypothetical protein
MRGKLSPFFIKNIISKRCINSMEAKQTIFQLTICIIRVLFDIKVPFVDLFLFVCLSVLLYSFKNLSHFYGPLLRHFLLHDLSYALSNFSQYCQSQDFSTNNIYTYVTKQ